MGKRNGKEMAFLGSEVLQINPSLLKPMLHFMIRAEIKKPKSLTVEELEMWLDLIVLSQGMHIVIPSRVYNVEDPSNSGPTGSCNVSTSHAAFHIWDNLGTTGLIQFDFFTCSCMNQEELLQHVNDAFEIINYHYLVYDRQETFVIVDEARSEWD